MGPFSKVTHTVWPMKMVPKYCPETSVPNYQSVPRKIPDKRRTTFLCLFLPSSKRGYFLL